MKRIVAILLACALALSLPMTAFAKDPQADNDSVQEYRNFIISLNEQYPDAHLDVDYQVKRALEIDQLSAAEKKKVVENDLTQGPIAKYTNVSAEGVSSELVVFASGNTAGTYAILGTSSVVGNTTTYTGTQVRCYYTMGSKQLVAGYNCNHTSSPTSSSISRPVTPYGPPVWVQIIQYNYVNSIYDFGTSNSYCKVTGTWAHYDYECLVYDVFIGVRFDANLLCTTLYL